MGWLLPPSGRFAGRTVESAEHCVIEEIGAESTIELLGALGSSEARAALGRLSVKPTARRVGTMRRRLRVFFDPSPGSSCLG